MAIENRSNARIEQLMTFLCDALAEAPDLAAMTDFEAGDEMVGALVIPFGRRSTSEGPLWMTGLMSYVLPDGNVPGLLGLDAIHTAYKRYFGSVNAQRLEVLTAYAAGDIELDEVSGILGEDLVTTARALKLAVMPTARGELGPLVANMRATLAE